MTEIQICVAYLHALRAVLDGRAGQPVPRHTLGPSRQARHRDEVGAGVAETVILVAIFAAGAIVIGTIIISKFTGKANSIPTGP